MALQTALRDFLAKSGESKPMLDHKFHTTYERAKKIVHSRFELWQRAAGAKSPPDVPPVLPDETQGN